MRLNNIIFRVRGFSQLDSDEQTKTEYWTGPLQSVEQMVDGNLG